MSIRFSTRFLLLMILALLSFPFVCSAQDTGNPFHVGTTVEEVFTWYQGLYMGVIMILTRLQAWLFPNAGSLPRTATRYVLIAAVVGILFVALGWANAWGIVIGFVTSALAYDKAVEPISQLPGLSWLKTPKPIAA